MHMSDSFRPFGTGRGQLITCNDVQHRVNHDDALTDVHSPSERCYHILRPSPSSPLICILIQDHSGGCRYAVTSLSFSVRLKAPHVTPSLAHIAISLALAPETRLPTSTSPAPKIKSRTTARSFHSAPAVVANSHSLFTRSRRPLNISSPQ